MSVSTKDALTAIYKNLKSNRSIFNPLEVEYDSYCSPTSVDIHWAICALCISISWVIGIVLVSGGGVEGAVPVVLYLIGTMYLSKAVVSQIVKVK